AGRQGGPGREGGEGRRVETIAAGSRGVGRAGTSAPPLLFPVPKLYRLSCDSTSAGIGLPGPRRKCVIRSWRGWDGFVLACRRIAGWLPPFRSVLRRVSAAARTNGTCPAFRKL